MSYYKLLGKYSLIKNVNDPGLTLVTVSTQTAGRFEAKVIN